MSVAQLRPRKPMPVSDIELADALNAQIRFAQAIELAIVGEAAIYGFDAGDLSTLTSAHVEGLKAVAEKFEALRNGVC